MLRCDVAFSRWDPVRDLLALHDQIGQLVGSDAPGWTPPVDLYETAAASSLTAELPGLARERDRDSRRGKPHRHSRRARRRAGALRAVPPRRTGTRPLLAGVPAARADRRRGGHGRPKDGLLTVTIPKAADAAPGGVSNLTRWPRAVAMPAPRSRRSSEPELVLVPSSSPAPRLDRARDAGLRRHGARRPADASDAADAARRPRSTAAATPPPRPAVQRHRGRPDFTQFAGHAVKGVANISSLQVVRAPNSPFANDPFFQYFFGDQDDFRLARPALAEPRVRRHRLRRRLHRHQQPRGRRQRARDHRRPADKREVKGQAHRHRPGHRHRTAQDRSQRAARPAVGRLVEAAGRRMGAGHRKPVSVEPDRHGRHHQRNRPRDVGFADYEDFIQTDAAINPGNSGGASSTRAANWSGSTPASSARAAATRASGSPSRATSPSTSSTT